MSIESEILRIQRNVANAYAAVSEKGGEVPLQPTSANLEAAVRSIQTGVTQEQLDEAMAVKQDKLTGHPGQVVGFNASGTAQTVQGWSNPNLLDNWYFRDPVNQRGQENYVDTRYTVDRWCHSRSTISIEEDGIGILWDGTGANGLCYEYIPINQIEPGQKYTFSALVKDLGLICVTASALSAPPPAYTTLAFSPNAEVRLELSEGSTNGNQWMQCSIRTYTTEKWVIKAVKLELGAQQTLAHQDAEGSWVLNDPPPNKALELAKCQRYQVAFSVPYTVIGSGFAINSTTAHIHLVLANLAGNAAASIKNIYLVSANRPGANGIIATEIDTLYGENGTFGTTAYCAGGLTPGEPLFLQLRTNSYFIADKNL